MAPRGFMQETDTTLAADEIDFAETQIRQALSTLDKHDGMALAAAYLSMALDTMTDSKKSEQISRQ